MRLKHLPRWLREIGIFLLTFSLLFLPWLSTTLRPDSDPIIVMGWEFILDPLGDLTPSVPFVIAGFICFWIAYILSRLLPIRHSFLFLYPFFAACTLYLAMYSRYFLFVPRGFRGTPSMIDVGFGTASGLSLSCLGSILLLWGVLFLQPNRFRFGAAIIGAFSGWVLCFFILIVLNVPYGTARSPYYLAFTFIGITLAFWLARRTKAIPLTD